MIEKRPVWSKDEKAPALKEIEKHINAEDIVIEACPTIAYDVKRKKYYQLSYKFCNGNAIRAKALKRERVRLEFIHGISGIAIHIARVHSDQFDEEEPEEEGIVRHEWVWEEC